MHHITRANCIQKLRNGIIIVEQAGKISCHSRFALVHSQQLHQVTQGNDVFTENNIDDNKNKQWIIVR